MSCYDTIAANILKAYHRNDPIKQGPWWVYTFCSMGPLLSPSTK